MFRHVHVCVYICLYIYTHIYMYATHTHIHIHTQALACACLPVCLSACPSVCLSACRPVTVSACLPACPPVCPSVCLDVKAILLKPTFCLHLLWSRDGSKEARATSSDWRGARAKASAAAAGRPGSAGPIGISPKAPCRMVCPGAGGPRQCANPLRRLVQNHGAGRRGSGSGDPHRLRLPIRPALVALHLVRAFLPLLRKVLGQAQPAKRRTARSSHSDAGTGRPVLG